MKSFLLALAVVQLSIGLGTTKPPSNEQETVENNQQSLRLDAYIIERRTSDEHTPRSSFEETLKKHLERLQDNKLKLTVSQFLFYSNESFKNRLARDRWFNPDEQKPNAFFIDLHDGVYFYFYDASQQRLFVRILSDSSDSQLSRFEDLINLIDLVVLNFSDFYAALRQRKTSDSSPASGNSFIEIQMPSVGLIESRAVSEETATQQESSTEENAQQQRPLSSLPASTEKQLSPTSTPRQVLKKEDETKWKRLQLTFGYFGDSFAPSLGLSSFVSLGLGWNPTPNSFIVFSLALSPHFYLRSPVFSVRTYRFPISISGGQTWEIFFSWFRLGWVAGLNVDALTFAWQPERTRPSIQENAQLPPNQALFSIGTAIKLSLLATSSIHINLQPGVLLSVNQPDFRLEARQRELLLFRASRWRFWLRVEMSVRFLNR